MIEKTKIEKDFNVTEALVCNQSHKWSIVTVKDEYQVDCIWDGKFGDILGNGTEYEGIVGLITLPNGARIPSYWDTKGRLLDPFHSHDFDLKMVRFEDVLDSLTSEDIPDSEEFHKSFEDYNKYANRMDSLEYLRYKTFCDNHRHCCGGIVTSFMGTGIGPVIHCKCEGCGKEVDITNVDNW